MNIAQLNPRDSELPESALALSPSYHEEFLRELFVQLFSVGK